jgi:hypothetical protein
MSPWRIWKMPENKHDLDEEEQEILKELREVQMYLVRETEIRREANQRTYQICHESG